jgi:hypothetical protein
MLGLGYQTGPSFCGLGTKISLTLRATLPA